MTSLVSLSSLLLASLLSVAAHAAAPLTLSSPNGDILVDVQVADILSFSIDFQREAVLEKGVIALELLGQTMGEAPRLLNSAPSTTEAVVPVRVPLKSSTLDEHYNALLLTFEGDFQVEFRAFNDGVSYRFITTMDAPVTVVDERADYQFADNYKAYLSETEATFSNYEHVFKPVWLQDFEDEQLAVLPLFVDADHAKVLIAEADLYDYPAMLLEGGMGDVLSGWYPPLSHQDGSSRRQVLVG